MMDICLAALLVSWSQLAHAAEVAAPRAKGILPWLAGALLVPLAWRWARANVPALVAGWVVSRVKDALAGKGIENGDLQELVHACVLAGVKYAEKKLPDSGLGPRRMALVESALTGLPLIGFLLSWVIQSNPGAWQAIVEECVKRMDDDARKLLAPVPPSPNPPASP